METWSVPNGETVLKDLQTKAETHKEQISSAAVPLVEHFTLVLGKKTNHSRGVGVPAINQGAKERHRIHAQARAAEQHADDAQQHVTALQDEVERLTEANMQLQGELQSQREELSSQGRAVEAYSVDMERLMDEKLAERLNAMMAQMTCVNGASFPPST